MFQNCCCTRKNVDITQNIAGDHRICHTCWSSEHSNQNFQFCFCWYLPYSGSYIRLHFQSNRITSHMKNIVHKKGDGSRKFAWFNKINIISEFIQLFLFEPSSSPQIRKLAFLLWKSKLWCGWGTSKYTQFMKSIAPTQYKWNVLCRFHIGCKLQARKIWYDKRWLEMDWGKFYLHSMRS